MHSVTAFLPKRVWVSLLPITSTDALFFATFKEWLFNNISMLESVEMGDSWSLVLGITVRKIWYWRNQFRFANNFPCSLHVVSDIRE